MSSGAVEDGAVDPALLDRVAKGVGAKYDDDESAVRARANPSDEAAAFLTT